MIKHSRSVFDHEIVSRPKWRRSFSHGPFLICKFSNKTTIKHFRLNTNKSFYFFQCGPFANGSFLHVCIEMYACCCDLMLTLEHQLHVPEQLIRYHLSYISDMKRINCCLIMSLSVGRINFS